MEWQINHIKQLYGYHNEEFKFKHRFSSIWLPKKNGKSTYMSALGLFNILWQPGNDVFIISPTIKQSQMVFAEACAMVEQHPDLKKRLWVRRHLNKIEDLKTRSKLEILSCSPEVSGHNAGMIILDELAEFPKCHCQIVLDKIANAGQSRPYYHQISISTAQFDREHPGYHNYRQAKQVINKEIDRPDILPIIFEIPEHSSWRDLENLKIANPASDVLWPFQNIIDDLKAVNQSPIEETRFRTLVGNQWVGHTSAWISQDLFAQCGQDLKEEDFYGSEAIIGIDFARKYDLGAYSLLIKKEEKIYVFPRFFIPENFAITKEKMDNVPYLRSWKDDPKANLYLTPGDVIDPKFLRNKIAEDSKNFKITSIYYDSRFMEETRQILEESGFNMIEVGQNNKIMSPSYNLFERMIYRKTLVHNNNPILNWNLGNCTIRTGTSGDDIMIDKRKSTARVDGVTSIAIGLVSELTAPDWYTIPQFTL